MIKNLLFVVEMSRDSLLTTQRQESEKLMSSQKSDNNRKKVTIIDTRMVHSPVIFHSW